MTTKRSVKLREHLYIQVQGNVRQMFNLLLNQGARRKKRVEKLIHSKKSDGRESGKSQQVCRFVCVCVWRQR